MPNENAQALSREVPSKLDLSVQSSVEGLYSQVVLETPLTVPVETYPKPPAENAAVDARF